MRVALVYDRVNKWGGAERVLLALHEIYKDAPLYTAVYSKKGAPWAEVFPEVVPSFLQKVPFAKERHEFLGSLTPIAFETFDFSGYDLVISVTSEAAKGIITKPGTKHVCYMLTPTRYLWSGHDFYFKNPPSMLGWIPFFKTLSKPFTSYLRTWDKIAAQRPDRIIAISNAVKDRVKKYYKRDADVIFPPVSLKGADGKKEKEDFYLLVSRLIPYKRADIAIKAFNELKLPLYIVGHGSEEGRLKRLAGDNIKFLGELTDKELADYYKRARALVFPQEEDFGIVAVEAQLFGTPVIAFNKGGAKDTLIKGKTGVFFNRQTPNAIIKGVKSFEKKSFDENFIRKNAKKFSKKRFKKEFSEIIDKELNGRR